MSKQRLKILIVEDEALVALELSMSIQRHNYEVVDYVSTVKNALSALEKNEINLIIMDINLNDDLDGIELYKISQSNAMLIYLTAYKDEVTMDRAIETQPLGYLVKPFNENELLALLKIAQLKLNAKKTLNTIKTLSNNYTFDMQQNRLFYKEKFIQLGKKTLKLLIMLIEAKGNVVSFKEIEEELYQEGPPSASSIRTLIYRLRNQLKAEMIETELNYGVRLVID